VFLLGPVEPLLLVLGSGVVRLLARALELDLRDLGIERGLVRRERLRARDRQEHGLLLAHEARELIVCVIVSEPCHRSLL
jgi:hypothetical protein